MNFKLCNNGLSVIGIAENGMYISISAESNEYKQWLAEGNTPEPEFTEEELQITSINKQIQEAKTYLASTDYKMTVDYFATLTKEVQDELTTKRAESREFIRINTGVVK